MVLNNTTLIDLKSFTRYLKNNKKPRKRVLEGNRRYFSIFLLKSLNFFDVNGFFFGGGIKLKYFFNLLLTQFN